MEGDPFQCHVYLIENGKNSVLIDPGSKLTFHHTLHKINEVIPFGHVKYFICQHQDPDITGALPLIESLLTRKDVVFASHWRAIALLKHYGLKTPFTCIEKEGWKLDIGGRVLKFIFTPYLHFPGAFCTFDPSTGVLFSSDLFGGFTDNWSLYAKDESYLESIRPFHEHYMPSREILAHSLAKFESLPLKLIAPQHGSIIKGKLIKFMINHMKAMECGLYLMTETSTDVARLSQLNSVLKKFLNAIIIQRDFNNIATELLAVAREIIPAVELSFYAVNYEGKILCFNPETRYRGIFSSLPVEVEGIIGLNPNEWAAGFGKEYLLVDKEDKTASGQIYKQIIVIPLFESEKQTIHAAAIFYLSRKMTVNPEVKKVILQMSAPLSVSIEREIIFRTMELEKQKFYEQAIRDPLTKLYTRTYMMDAVQRLCDMHDRNKLPEVFVAVFDIDDFKKINDTYGHEAGDRVIQLVAGTIRTETRRSDIQVRLGGDEFALFLPSKGQQTVGKILRRIVHKIENSKLAAELDGVTLSLSGGIVRRRKDEHIGGTIQRADLLLYQAKNAGKKQIESDYT
jgi:diguanylate cyclase (GGDEF)-like protein